MSVSSARASTHPVGRRTLRGPAVVVVVVVAAIAGLLLGGSLSGSDAPAGRPATAPQPIAHNGLRLQVPRGWTRGDVATAPGFSRPLGLRNEGEGLRATVERLPATSATLLPAAFVETLESAPQRPAVVRLASGGQAWRYRFPGRDGSMTLLYAAPTTSGIATVACTSPLDANVPRACEALAGAVSVPGSRPLEPSTSAAFLSALPGAVSDLDAARAKGLDELDGATRSAGQALAADDLARAHKAAGAALAPLSTEGADLPTATVGALTATATAYAALASAARDRSPRPYADAGRAVAASDTDLRRTMAKAAAAASAATRTATRTASTPVRTPAAPAKPAARKEPAGETKPAARKKPAAQTKPAADKANPAASASQGSDVTLLILGAIGAVALFLGVREIRRVWLSAAEAQ